MYPKGAELNPYNPREFMFTAHQPNPLRAHRGVAKMPETGKPCSLLIATQRHGRQSFLVPASKGEEASFLHHPQSPEIATKLESSILHISASLWLQGELGFCPQEPQNTDCQMRGRFGGNPIPVCKQTSSASSSLTPKFASCSHGKFQTES